MEGNTNVTAGGATGTANVTEPSQQQGQKVAEPSPKTFTQEELQAETDRRVTEALKAAKAEWMKDYNTKLEAEKDQAVKLAKMSADERAKAEFEAEKEKFSEEREQYAKERLEFECAKQLGENSLPVNFSSWLTGKDAETTKTNIETFKAEFVKAVQAGVEERLKGKTPPAGKSNNFETDPFLSGFGN